MNEKILNANYEWREHKQKLKFPLATSGRNIVDTLGENNIYLI